MHRKTVRQDQIEGFSRQSGGPRYQDRGPTASGVPAARGSLEDDTSHAAARCLGGPTLGRLRAGTGSQSGLDSRGGIF